MNQSPMQMLREFHERYGVPARSEPLKLKEIPLAEWALRRRLIMEEFDEFTRAYLHGRAPEELAKELADLAYVVYGTAVQFGIDLDAVLAEVHCSNMTKGTNGEVIYDAGGKVLKGEDYVPPDIGSVLYGKEIA